MPNLKFMPMDFEICGDLAGIRLQVFYGALMLDNIIGKRLISSTQGLITDGTLWKAIIAIPQDQIVAQKVLNPQFLNIHYT